MFFILVCLPIKQLCLIVLLCVWSVSGQGGLVFLGHGRLESLVQDIGLQRLVPAVRLMAKVRATAVLLAGWVNSYLTVRLAHQPDELPLILFFAADNTTALRNVLGTAHTNSQA
jgi:hypothetical protein